MSNISSEIKAKLGEKLKSYFIQNEAEKAAKKLKEPLNKEVKKIMVENKITEFEFDGILASYNLQERTSMNEDKLLNRLKELGFTQAIEQVERPNTSVLETLIYDGTLDPELIANCNETKYVEVLNVKKKKVAQPKVTKK